MTIQPHIVVIHRANLYGLGFLLFILIGCGDRSGADAIGESATADTSSMALELWDDVSPESVIETQQGEATFYADMLNLKMTASGEPLDQTKLVAAHRRYPFGTILRVTNLENQRSVKVRVIDRGPFGPAKKAEEKVIDLSRRAAEELGFIEEGRALVQVDVLEMGDGVAQSGA